MRLLDLHPLTPSPGDPPMGRFKAPGSLHRTGLAVRLAVADFVHERRLSLCSVLGLAAVVAPLLVLYGLKFGLISGMIDTLVQDPRARELTPIGHGVYDAAFFETLARRPEVGFLQPTTRFLAATLSLRNREVASAPLVSATELWPTRSGDPFLAGLNAPLALDHVVLSRRAADKLQAGPGSVLEARVGRSWNGRDEAERFSLTVDAVAPAAGVERDVAFVDPALLLAVESYREGRAVAAFGWSGTPAPDTPLPYASFRLFARDINAVEPLRDILAARGIATQSRLADIRMIRSLDQNLMVLFTVVAGLGVGGAMVAQAVSLWAMTERKRRDLAALRLIGFTAGSVAAIPLTNALLTALLGTALASGLYLGLEWGLNATLARQITLEGFAVRLEPYHHALALGITVGAAALSSVAAGLNAARQQPSEGLRDV